MSDDGLDIGDSFDDVVDDAMVAWARRITGTADPVGGGDGNDDGDGGNDAVGAGAATDVPGNGELFPAPSDPMAVVRHISHHWEALVDDADGVKRVARTLGHWQDAWMRWQGTHWAEATPGEMKVELYEMLEDALYLHTQRRQNGAVIEWIDRWRPNRSKVGDVVESLAATFHLSRTVNDGDWLDGRVVGERLIACQNGLVNPVTREMAPHSPWYFNQSVVPFAFEREAREPRAWLAFLDSVWGGDPGVVMALQEWLGYLVSGRTNLQKILLLLGPKRSGKGTIGRVMRCLVGPENTAGPTMSSMATQFGLSSMIGKSLAMISDARMTSMSRESKDMVLERLLTISGEDTLDVDRKNRSIWTGRLGVRFAMMSNNVPDFHDPSNAIGSRYLVLTMTRSFAGREDRDLEAKLMAELPGIFNWALDGLDRLRERGEFISPESSDTVTDMMSEAASPVSVFIEECCVVHPEASEATERIREAYKTWCAQNDRQPLSSQRLGMELAACVPGLGKKKATRHDANGERPMSYTGLRLRLNTAMVPRL